MIHRKSEQARVAAHRIARRLMERGLPTLALRIADAAERGEARSLLDDPEIPEDLREELRRAVEPE
ncbi:MAG: hypothetical protein HYY17_03015 [Planctomycetes bacterium]|nr:hypothetical protein [Planctomycetota bacterium]